MPFPFYAEHVDSYNWLPIVMCIISACIASVSVPMNGMVLITVVKNKKFQTIFYIILGNILTSDFLIAIVFCPLSIHIHMCEIRNTEANGLIKKIFQYGLFTLCVITALFEGVLCVDRLVSLKLPSRYRLMKRRYFAVFLAVIWLSVIVLTSLFVSVTETNYLLVISLFIILLSTTMMLLTYVTYRLQLRKSYVKAISTLKDIELPVSSASFNRELISSLPTSLKRKFSRGRKESTTSFNSSSQNRIDHEYQNYLMEQRATNTFFCMLLVFLLCYIPLVGISIAIFYTQTVDGLIKTELLHKSTILLGLLSSIGKTIVLLLRLTALRKACGNLLISEKKMENKWRKESVPVTLKKYSPKHNLLKEQMHETIEEHADEEPSRIELTS